MLDFLQRWRTNRLQDELGRLRANIPRMHSGRPRTAPTVPPNSDFPEANRKIPTIALVDFMSICTGPKSDPAVRDSLDLLAELIRTTIRARLEQGDLHVYEIDVRLYGGWRDINGAPTEHRVWLLRHLTSLRGVSNRIRLVPTVVDAMICAPGAELWGTYKNKTQKMVDGMLTIDALSISRSGEHACLLLISDDDDFVPAMLALNVEKTVKVLWLRQRGTAGNDRHFADTHTELAVSDLWR